MKLSNYNLSVTQKFFAPVIALLWWLTPKEKRKATIHLVFKGMEKHTHCFSSTPSETKIIGDYKICLYPCRHEGCNVHSTSQTLTTEGAERRMRYERLENEIAEKQKRLYADLDIINAQVEQITAKMKNL